MDFQDHAYTSITLDVEATPEYSYKMSVRETEEFVKLRMSNNYLFSGKRNAAMSGWRAILKHMNLQDRMTHVQASRKWENMKRKYKDLTNPPDGVEVCPESWRFFRLMNDAMEGRLQGNAPILRDASCLKLCGSPTPKKSRMSGEWPCETLSVETPGPLANQPADEIEVTLNGEHEEAAAVLEGSRELDSIMRDLADERSLMDGERREVERDKRAAARERLALQRERAALDREAAALDRDRAALERERAAVERERAAAARERAAAEQERDAALKERLAWEQERARRSAPKERAADDGGGGGEGDGLRDSDALERKERFLDLFEKLIDNF